MAHRTTHRSMTALAAAAMLLPLVTFGSGCVVVRKKPHRPHHAAVKPRPAPVVVQPVKVVAVVPAHPHGR